MSFIVNNNSMFPTYLESSEYKKGDRIYLTPHNENQQTFSGTRTNFMGKRITYSTETTANEYPFRIRSAVDNPRDPNLPGMFGTDWVCDEPHAIVEEGSNSNGSYTLYAGGGLLEYVVKLNSNTWDIQGWTYPLKTINEDTFIGTKGKYSENVYPELVVRVFTANESSCSFKGYVSNHSVGYWIPYTGNIHLFLNERWY